MSRSIKKRNLEYGQYEEPSLANPNCTQLISRQWLKNHTSKNTCRCAFEHP